MEPLMILLGWTGIYGVLALSAIASALGCARAGQAANGAMLEVDGGYGRFIGLSAMPSSQTIYGIVVMLALNREVTAVNGPGLFAIGVLAGLALMVSAVLQGNCCRAWIIERNNTGKNFVKHDAE